MYFYKWLFKSPGSPIPTLQFFKYMVWIFEKSPEFHRGKSISAVVQLHCSRNFKINFFVEASLLLKEKNHLLVIYFCIDLGHEIDFWKLILLKNV